MTGAAAIASVVPAVGSTETTSSSAVSSQSVSVNSDTQALSPVSLRVDDVDVKGCVTPGQTVTASGSGFDVASSTPKVFIAFGLFSGKHPEASQVISVEGSVKSATSMSFVVPAASRFGKSSIAGANLTVVWSSTSTYSMGPMIAFEVCSASGQSGNSNPSSSLRVDDVDVKGCVTPGQTVTASGSGFDVASSTPKVFIAFGLFYGKHPEASQVISVEGSVKSATSMSFVVPAASRFGKSSIAGANLTVVWSSTSTYSMGPKIAFEVCAAGTSGGTSGGTSQSGNSGSSSKPTATTVAKSSGTTSLVGKKCAPAGLTLNVYGTKVICKKSGSTLRWAVAGK
jgi:Tat protein secretion system quality control protein TatD with DNase activity